MPWSKFGLISASCATGLAFMPLSAAHSADAVPTPIAKPALNPALLTWKVPGQRAAIADEDDALVAWNDEGLKRYSVYGATLYSVDVDLSFGLKPKRIMSLEAAW